jgi:hypothetical protein
VHGVHIANRAAAELRTSKEKIANMKELLVSVEEVRYLLALAYLALIVAGGTCFGMVGWAIKSSANRRAHAIVSAFLAVGMISNCIIIILLSASSTAST